MGAGGWGSAHRGWGYGGDPFGWTVAKATASLSGSIHLSPYPHPPPTCSPTRSRSLPIERLRMDPTGRLQSPALVFISTRPPRFTPNSPLPPPRVRAHHTGGRLTHLIVGAQLRITICLLGKMGSQLQCVPRNLVETISRPFDSSSRGLQPPNPPLALTPPSLPPSHLGPLAYTSHRPCVYIHTVKKNTYCI